MGRSPSRSYWSGMRLLQFRQVKCHPFIPLKSLSSSSLPRQFRSRIHEIRASERASEGRARVDPHFFSGGRGECQPASSAPSPAPISPAGISSRCASGFTLTSRGTLALSLSIGATVFWQTLTVRARSGVGDAHAELLMLPKMSVTYDRRGLEIHYQFRSD